jgi:hypothetical protein
VGCFAEVSATTFWSFLREFSSLEVCARWTKCSVESGNPGTAFGQIHRAGLGFHVMAVPISLTRCGFGYLLRQQLDQFGWKSMSTARMSDTMPCGSSPFANRVRLSWLPQVPWECGYRYRSTSHSVFDHGKRNEGVGCCVRPRRIRSAFEVR